MGTEIIEVMCGANIYKLENLNGMPVEVLLQRLSEVLNVPKEAEVIVNGHIVDKTTYVIASGDRIEFVKPAGTKGSTKGDQ